MSDEKKVEPQTPASYPPTEAHPTDPPKQREDEDTIRHSLREATSKAQNDLEESARALQQAAEESAKSARSLMLESRRTRMASRPSMKSPYAKK